MQIGRFEAVTAALLLVVVLSVMGTRQLAAAPPTVPSALPAGADSVRELAQKALRLARDKKHAEAVKLLDRVLDLDPKFTKARFLRAKLHLKLKAYDPALADAEQVVKEMPSISGAAEFLARARGEKQANTVVYSASSKSYSEWDRVWTVPGKDAFTLAQFKGAEGYTVFYAPARPGDRAEVEPYMVDANDQQLYFLRIVDLKGADGNVDLALPGATGAAISKVPFMIILDPKGAELGRGDPSALTKELEAVRKEAGSKKKAPPANEEPAAHQDFSQSQEPLETLAVRGCTTVVMVTSPG